MQRARFGLVALVVLLLALVWISRQQQSVSEQVTARVVTVDRGTGDDDPIEVFIARVRLDDGSEARIVVREPLPAVGDRVALIGTMYGDGSRRYRLDPARERSAPAR